MDRSAVDISDLAELAIPSVPGASSGPASASASVATAPAPEARPTSATIAGSSAVDDDPFDYGTDAIPDDAEVAKAFADLDRLTLQAEQLTAQRKRAEEQLDKLKKAEDQLLNRDIPELLAKMRLDECVTASGVQVKVKRDIRASLPGQDRVEARMAALRWLVDHGHGGVIKNQVSISLDRGDDSRADDLVVRLRAEGLDVEAKKDVHNQTLSALARELMANGTVIPAGTINVYDQRVAKLTRK